MGLIKKLGMREITEGHQSFSISQEEYESARERIDKKIRESRHYRGLIIPYCSKCKRPYEEMMLR